MEGIEMTPQDTVTNGTPAPSTIPPEPFQSNDSTPASATAPMFPMNGTPNGNQAAAKPAIVLPVVLLFGTEQVPQQHVLSHDEMQKLPENVLSHILKSGNSVGEGPMKVHMLGATRLCDSLLRVKEFLNHGDYQPFNPKIPLQVVNKSGKVITVDGPVDNAEGLRTTDETHALFRKEVALYVFAGCYRYTQLLEFSSLKIRTAYPVLGKETLLLIEKAHRIATQSKDQELLEFISAAAKKNAKDLTREPGFIPLLKKCITADPLHHVLFDAYVSQAQAAKAALDADSLLASLPMSSNMTSTMGNNAPPPSSPGIKSEISLESRITRPLVPTASQQLFQLKEVLLQERLVIAKDDGYGTLISPNHREGDPITRNRDFKFIKNELLLITYWGKSFNGRHNIQVENSKGMRGDILGSLVKTVPMDLGVADFQVNCGREDLDREQRTQFEMDKVFSYRRSRSRSPARW